MNNKDSLILFPSKFEEHTIAEFNRIVERIEKIEKQIQLLKKEVGNRSAK